MLGPLNLSLGAVSIVVGTFLMTFISKQTEWLNVVSLCMTLLSCILTLCLLPDSPKHQLSQGLVDKSTQGLTYIAKVNGSTQNFDDWNVVLSEAITSKPSV